MQYWSWIEFAGTVFIVSLFAGYAFQKLLTFRKDSKLKKYGRMPIVFAIAAAVLASMAANLYRINIDDYRPVSNIMEHYDIDVSTLLDLRTTEEYMKENNVSMDQVVEIKRDSELFRVVNDSEVIKAEDFKLMDKLVFAKGVNIIEEKFYVDIMIEKDDKPFCIRAEDVTGTQHKGTVTNKVLVYDRPDTECNIIGEIGEGTEVNVVAEENNGGWCFILSQNIVGFIQTEYIKAE